MSLRVFAYTTRAIYCQHLHLVIVMYLTCRPQWRLVDIVEMDSKGPTQRHYDEKFMTIWKLLRFYFSHARVRVRLFTLALKRNKLLLRFKRGKIFHQIYDSS